MKHLTKCSSTTFQPLSNVPALLMDLSGWSAYHDRLTSLFDRKCKEFNIRESRRSWFTVYGDLLQPN